MKPGLDGASKVKEVGDDLKGEGRRRLASFKRRHCGALSTHTPRTSRNPPRHTKSVATMGDSPCSTGGKSAVIVLFSFWKAKFAESEESNKQKKKHTTSAATVYTLYVIDGCFTEFRK